jgi:hypothetical protein
VLPLQVKNKIKNKPKYTVQVRKLAIARESIALLQKGLFSFCRHITGSDEDHTSHPRMNFTCNRAQDAP